MASSTLLAQRDAALKAASAPLMRHQVELLAGVPLTRTTLPQSDVIAIAGYHLQLLDIEKTGAACLPAPPACIADAVSAQLARATAALAPTA